MRVRDMKILLEQFDDNDFVVVQAGTVLGLPKKIERSVIVTTEYKGKRRFILNPRTMPIHTIGSGEVVLIY